MIRVPVMRLLTYDREGARRLGAWVETSVVDLPDAVGHPVFPASMEGLVARHGGTTLDAAREALAHPGVIEEFSVARPRVLAPLVASVHHVDRPVVLGPDEALDQRLSDGELRMLPQIACLIGRPGARTPLDTAEGLIFGYTMMTRWTHSAGGTSRLLAVSLGPLVVTPDDFEPSGLRVHLRTDGRALRSERLQITRGEILDSVARISGRRELRVGEALGIAAFPGMEAPDGFAVWPGTIVELEAAGLGTLRTCVGLRTRPGTRARRPRNRDRQP